MPGSVHEMYSRPVTADEWWRLGAPPGLSTEVQLCVEGDGTDRSRGARPRPSPPPAQACPGTRLVRRGQLWVDSGRTPDVRVVEADGFDRVRLDSPLLRTPLACQGRSSCEVVLIQGTPTTVIFRAHPGVMDGRGAMLWQREIFRALRGEAVEPADSRLTHDDVMAEIAARLDIGLPPRTGPSQHQWRSVMGTVPSGPRRSLWRRRTIDGIHLGVSAKIARLVTAYGAEGGEGLVGMPVDMREFLPGLRTTAGVTGHVKVYVRPGRRLERRGRQAAHRPGRAPVPGPPGRPGGPHHAGAVHARDAPLAGQPGPAEPRHGPGEEARRVRRERLPPGRRRPGGAQRRRVRGDLVLLPGGGQLRPGARHPRKPRPDRDHPHLAGRSRGGRTRRGPARPHRGISLTARLPQLGRQPAPPARRRRRRSPGCSPGRRSGHPARWPSAAAPTAS